MAQTSAEDCLSLAVYTPMKSSPHDKLPVGLFVPGGSFKGGGLDAPYYNPSGWVNRSQQHIIVAINYRVNIFGFPNAVGLENQNLGMLDQRLALEWVRDNIAVFGGDPDRITLWGHSAGGVSVDVLNFAYPDDPIAAGLFLMSGAAMRTFAHGANALQDNFTYVAKELGCDSPSEPEAVLDCMREVPVNLITNFVGHYGDEKRKPQIYFRPTVDNKTVFQNYTERAQAGLLSGVPALVTDTSNEQSSLISYPADNLSVGPNEINVYKGTLSDFICPAYNTSSARAARNLTTYRYQYVGNYTNLSPYPWMGAYHGADVPMIFGSYNKTGGATDIQKKVAESMQDYVFAFLSDPKNGLAKLGWLPSNGPHGGDGPMARFGGARNIMQIISSTDVDDACMGRGTYDSHPNV
ncbi:Alpha/Beta hydrolase protein [Xylariaceae sp. FL0016]|nr:Alpha/Beta hydrolase protein [Xylariaceae sp. FL0016]